MSFIKDGTADFSSLEDLCRRQGFTDRSPLRLETGRRVTHVIRMEAIRGRTLFDASFPNSSQLDSDLFTSTFFRELGRLVIFDTFMGNNDRLCLSMSHVNTGNIMIEKNSGDLRPIDQEAPLLFGENEGSAQDKTRRHIIDSIPASGSLLAAAIADMISLEGDSRAEKIPFIEEGIRLAHAQVSNKTQMKTVLQALREDARLLDIPSSRLVEEF